MSAMQRYFEQLIDDIRESAKNKEENVKFVAPTLLDVPEHLAHLPVIPARKACDWFRLSLEAFPAAEKWDDDYQLVYMCVILRTLFEHYDINVDLPNDLPFDMTYEYLLKAMNEYTTCEQDNSCNTIDFCHEDSQACPFEDYCTKEDTDYCDNWMIGQYWYGFDVLAEMEEERKAAKDSKNEDNKEA